MRISTRPWGLDSARLDELLDTLRFRHFKWDTFACGARLVLPESIVLDAELHRRVVRTVEDLHQALLRFEERVCRDPKALEHMGIPTAIHPLVAADAPRLQCARYDLFPTEDGRLMVSEFNEDVPGGFNEAQGIPELLGNPGPGLRWEAGFRARFLEAFREFDAVALLHATAYSEDLQHMLILERWLAEDGHPTVLGSPAHLRGGGRLGRRRPRILGVPVEAAFRFYPGEWMPRLPNLSTWLRVGPRLPMMNPLRQLVRQSKLMFALWREEGALDAADRALLDAHCPRTESFRSAMADRLRDEPERWVLKRAFGRMGDSVVMGSLVTPEEWEAAIRAATRSPAGWCVQECFQVRPVGFEAGPMYPAIGAYVVNGRFAGYYSRVAPRPLTTHEAYHVGTLVQAA
jgi:glutathionylspermidine synthase